MSMRSVAMRADVPQVTLVRFAQTLGFAGWPQLKEAFALELGMAPEQYGQRAQSLIARGSQSGGNTALLDELFAVQAHNLQFTKTHNGEAWAGPPRCWPARRNCMWRGLGPATHWRFIWPMGCGCSARRCNYWTAMRAGWRCSCVPCNRVTPYW